ncbi:MAG: IS110 family transposase, partial [Chloroflexota bacterium]
GRTRKGSPWLRETLVEAGKAAGRSKHTYLSALYHRVAARRGANRAAVAVGHAILVCIYHMLKNHVPYQDLGADYFDERNRAKAARRAVERLQKLGYTVTIEPNAA